MGRNTDLDSFGLLLWLPSSRQPRPKSQSSARKETNSQCIVTQIKFVLHHVAGILSTRALAHEQTHILLICCYRSLDSCSSLEHICAHDFPRKQDNASAKGFALVLDMSMALVIHT